MAQRSDKPYHPPLDDLPGSTAHKSEMHRDTHQHAPESDASATAVATGALAQTPPNGPGQGQSLNNGVKRLSKNQRKKLNKKHSRNQNAHRSNSFHDIQGFSGNHRPLGRNTQNVVPAVRTSNPSTANALNSISVQQNRSSGRDHWDLDDSDQPPDPATPIIYSLLSSPTTSPSPSILEISSLPYSRGKVRASTEETIQAEPPRSKTSKEACPPTGKDLHPDSNPGLSSSACKKRSKRKSRNNDEGDNNENDNGQGHKRKKRKKKQEEEQEQRRGRQHRKRQ